MTQTTSYPSLRRLAKAAGLGPAVRWVRGFGRTPDRPPRRGAIDQEQMRRLITLGLRADSNCIDVGANVGSVLIHIVRAAPLGRHIAYEPIPHLAADLAARFPTVDLREAALSDRNGESTFQWVRNMEAHSGLFRRRYPGEPDIEQITVRTERLDDHLPIGYVPNLIKIDVEGAALYVLRGAVETLIRHQPMVLVEFGRLATPWTGTTSDDMYDFLTDTVHYRLYDFDGKGPYSRADFATTNYFNFVAHP